MHRHEDEEEKMPDGTNETPDPAHFPSPPTQAPTDVEGEDESLLALRAWLKQPTYRDERHFLEAHLKLLDSRTDPILARFMARHAENKEMARELHEHLALLRDVRKRGGTVAAIREAYVDTYDGLMLDLPMWLEEIEQQLVDLYQQIEHSDQTVTEHRNLLDGAIAHAKDDPCVAPETLAELWNILGRTLEADPRKDRTQSYEEAIEAHQRALQVYTLARYPRQYALTQRHLGNVYYKRIGGERRTNLEQAIACHEAALQVYTFETFPVEWAMTQYNLGNIYQKHITGERRTNLERVISYFKAALQVYTRDNFPRQWAMIQHNLGVASRERIEGERWINLEQAINCYEAAVQVHTHETFPMEWAMTQYNLGNIYRERIEGARRANLERAIASYEAALQVRTYDTYPVDWAKTQSNLGIAYRERVEGERRANLEQAIACYEAALRVYTRDLYPEDWAMTQHNLGNVYMVRSEGERRANVERAIAYYEAALQVRTREAFPEDWAMTQRSLGAAYFERLEGKERANLERAIACYQAALQIQTRDALPREWAATQHNLGVAYSRRIEGERKDNLEQAIVCYEDVLQVCTRDTYPEDWASIRHDLGTAYLERFAGERKNNLERAIACYEVALQVRTLEAFPREWALTQMHLGMVYYARLEGKRKDNLEQAIACYQAALQVYTRDAFPHEHRITQLNRTNAEAELQNWEGVHESCTEALAAEDILIRLGAGAIGRDAILKEGHDAASYDGFALSRLGQAAAAAVAIEHRRAFGLAEMLVLDTANPERIRDMGRRTRYEDARRVFIAAQAALNDPFSRDLSENEQRRITLERTDTYHQAMEVFEAMIAEIRAAQEPPDFLENALDTTTILHAATCGGAGHVLVYLVATPWGGIAVGALSANRHLDRPARFATLDLPHLTDDLVRSLFETKLGYTQRIIGGYIHAQEGNGWNWMRQQWAGETFRQMAEALHAACTATSQASTLAVAAQEVLNVPALAHLVNQPFDQLDSATEKRLSNTLGHLFLQVELQRCLEKLAEVAMHPLAAWLTEQRATSLTLVPCGTLAALPLASVPLADGRIVGETLPTSMAISARSLLRDEDITRQRTGVYAVGDPRPTHQELRWGEAEAHTLAKLARNYGLSGEARVHEKAVRSWLVLALHTGRVVDASCHGKFDANDFLQSALQLAGGKRLTLAEALNREVDLQGLRLLILSSCQTAVLDLRGARDEVRSLAAGMIQAGARAVLASLWSVDDKATYLLIVRFAQEWFPRIEQESPAAALARAQHWLRTVTNHELRQWQAIALPVLTKEERRKAGSTIPGSDPWEKEKSMPDESEKLVAVRGRGSRYDIGEATSWVRTEAGKRNDPDTYPYTDPIYWAGFQIIGW